MSRVIFFSFLVLISYSLFSQENNLDEFVKTQQSKLVYDSSKLVQIPNINALMIPPEHFVKDASINGFVHPGSATTIQVNELKNRTLQELEASMSEEYISSQAYKFISKKDMILENGKSAIIYTVQFSVKDVDYERMIFFTETENLIWINVNYPISIKKLIYPAIEASLKSVKSI